MEPGVPFALLGAVVLLAVAGWIGIAASALVRESGSRGAGVLIVLGGIVLAGTETATASLFGRESSDVLAISRTAGLLLLAAGLWGGALRQRPAPAVPGIVVPLAAAPAPSALAAAAGVVAAVAALRSRRDLAGILLALGLLLAAGSMAAAPLADTGDGAVLVLVLRGAGAVAVLGSLLLLTRASVLGKVVAAILAGVLVMATAAVVVVGTVVAGAAEREQAALLTAAAESRDQVLNQALSNAQAFTQIAAPACTANPASCGQVLERLTPALTENFALLVPASGTPVSLGGRAALSAAEALGLAGGPLVERVLAGGPNAVRADGLPTKVRLVGAEEGLALVVVVPGERAQPTAPATSAFVYGVRLGDTYVRNDFDDGGFGFSLLVDGEVVTSNLPDRGSAQVQRIANEARVASGVPQGGRTIAAVGDSPTVHFLPITDATGSAVGTLALSRDAENALESQRDALQVLLLTALVTTALVGALALLVGRRTVEPLRRLTSAASQVAAGDLSVRTGVSSRDEVGRLSRTFDAMTGSVAQLTGDLRASAVRLETVLSSMSDGLVATDTDGRITSINRAAVLMAGLPDAEAALGQPLHEVVDVRVGGEPLVLDARGRPDVDAEVHPADGDAVPVKAALAPLADGQGIVLVLRDTRREREVERMKTEFLSNVSHELRTPLTPIRGYADLLVSRPGLPSDKVTTFATTILAESIKMNRVVDLLVDVASIEAGRVTISPRPITPGEIVDARLAAWRGRAPERAADLKRRVAARLPAVQVDPGWLGKAIDELVDNAVKYTPPGTKITLGAALAPEGQRVRLFVRDAGPGIAAGDQQSLFLSFEQVDGSATRRVGGLGLGLSFVRRLAEDAGFPLTVTSDVGKGAEFALDLPLADDVPPAPRRPSPRRVRTKK